MQLKKTVFWGTGNVSINLHKNKFVYMPEFYIDSNENKHGQIHLGKKIMHPSKILNWNDLFIVLTMDNYISVKEQLKKKGLKEGVDFVWYQDLIMDAKIECVIEQAEAFIRKIEEDKTYFLNKKLIFSSFLFFDKGVCNYMNEWESKEPGFVLLSEAVWVKHEIAKSKIIFPTITLPNILGKDQYIKENSNSIIDKKYKSYVEKRKYLFKAAANLRMRYKDMCVNFEFLICYFADRIVRKILEFWQPKQVLVWNAFYAFHMIIGDICREKEVFISYMEFGNIPGTIIVEDFGQMGESYPARFPEIFMKIPVSEQQYKNAENLLKELYENKLNRNAQPQNDLLKKMRERLNNERPIVLYAGQNDNASGMQPYTERTLKFHSPIFKSSDEAAYYLAYICKKNNWNFIYKPHPMMVSLCNMELFPDNVIFVNDVNVNDLIDMVDTLATILSTISYTALIRNKPVVMFGYTQLKSKGCTYEAFAIEKVETELEKALKIGFTYEQREKYIQHIAQLNIYYKTNI